MQKFSLDFAETGLLNNLITDYLQQKDNIKPFYQYAPDIDSFADAIEQRKKFPFHRNTLVNVLNEQYAEVATVSEIVKQNIISLKTKIHLL